MTDRFFAAIDESGGGAPSDRPRRHRWRGWIAFGIVIVLLVAAVVVVNGLSRSVVEGVIRDKVRSTLDIPKSTPVQVRVGGGSVLLQALHGSLDDVDISADSVAIGSFSGNASVVIAGLPLDQSKPVGRLSADFVVNNLQLRALLTGDADLPVTSVAVGGGTVRVGSTVKVLGFSVPVGLRFMPGEKDGKLLLTLKTVEFRSLVITPAKFKNILGFIVDPLIKTRHICVASGIPKSLALDGVQVKGHQLYFGVTGKNVTLDSSLMSDKGTCK